MLMDDDEGPPASDSAPPGLPAPGGYAPIGPGAGAPQADDDTLDILESLAALSRQLAADAAEDDAIVQALATSWTGEAEQQAAGAHVQ